MGCGDSQIPLSEVLQNFLTAVPMHAEWHFFATSHGKSAGDGAGGTLKRLATRASLQHIYQDQILTALQLYQHGLEIYLSSRKIMDYVIITKMYVHVYTHTCTLSHAYVVNKSGVINK